MFFVVPSSIIRDSDSFDWHTFIAHYDAQPPSFFKLFAKFFDLTCSNTEACDALAYTDLLPVFSTHRRTLRACGWLFDHLLDASADDYTISLQLSDRCLAKLSSQRMSNDHTTALILLCFLLILSPADTYLFRRLMESQFSKEPLSSQIIAELVRLSRSLKGTFVDLSASASASSFAGFCPSPSPVARRSLSDALHSSLRKNVGSSSAGAGSCASSTVAPAVESVAEDLASIRSQLAVLARTVQSNPGKSSETSSKLNGCSQKSGLILGKSKGKPSALRKLVGSHALDSDSEDSSSSSSSSSSSDNAPGPACIVSGHKSRQPSRRVAFSDETTQSSSGVALPWNMASMFIEACAEYTTYSVRDAGVLDAITEHPSHLKAAIKALGSMQSTRPIDKARFDLVLRPILIHCVALMQASQAEMPAVILEFFSAVPRLMRAFMVAESVTYEELPVSRSDVTPTVQSRFLRHLVGRIIEEDDLATAAIRPAIKASLKSVGHTENTIRLSVQPGKGNRQSDISAALAAGGLPSGGPPRNPGRQPGGSGPGGGRGNGNGKNGGRGGGHKPQQQPFPPPSAAH